MTEEGSDARLQYLLNATTYTSNGATTGVSSGSIYGDVNQMFNGQSEPDLVAYRRSSDELDKASRQFVKPDGFDRAVNVLSRWNVVILCNPGTGREHAALALLQRCSAREIFQMEAQRSLGTVRVDELEEHCGYIWKVGDSSARPFADRDFDRCLAAMRAKSSRLVILLDWPRQCAPEAERYAVRLEPPDPVDVASAVLAYHEPDDYEQAEVLVKEHLDQVADSAPGQVARAAELAIDVVNGDIDAAEALRQQQEKVDTVVAHWFQDWDLREYSFALAVAVLENHSWDEIEAQARKLDQDFREAQLPEDRKLRPRRIFGKSKDELVRDINARLERRDHPRYAGLTEDTVHFARQGWADALLRHVWREYPLAHEVVHKWLCSLAHGPAKRALCTITAAVPARDPLRLVNGLARKASQRNRALAATALVSLAENHNLLPLVRNTLRDWVESGGAYEKWTAALVYSSPFGQRDLDEALQQLTRIGKSNQQTPQDAVIGGVLNMFRDPDHQNRLVDLVVSWVQPKYQRTGLRPVSLNLALWMLGFTSRADKELVRVAEQYESQARTLVRRVIHDQEFGAIALDRLSELMTLAQVGADAGDELVRLAQLIIPDLRWRHRRRSTAVLGELHPVRRSEIRRIFRAARKHQRRRARRDGLPTWWNRWLPA